MLSCSRDLVLPSPSVPHRWHPVHSPFIQQMFIEPLLAGLGIRDEVERKVGRAPVPEEFKSQASGKFYEHPTSRAEDE